MLANPDYKDQIEQRDGGCNEGGEQVVQAHAKRVTRTAMQPGLRRRFDN